MGGLARKLSLAIGCTAILFSCFLFYETYSLTKSRVREVVQQQAAMALKFDLAIRDYVGAHVRPLMYELLEEGEFIPETMSTSYVARTIFDDVRSEFPDYIIKFSSDNPRNPANQAGEEELELIKKFNADPELKRWEGEITIGGKLYTATFSARRMKPSCLVCHGDPADAPASMIAQYGAVAGFYRPIGDVVGLDTVAIPTTRVFEMLQNQTLQKFGKTGVVLATFLFVMAFTIKGMMLNRLGYIARHFRTAAQKEDYSSIEYISISGSDEIGDIARSYNALCDKLRNVYASLESDVQERTRELEFKNTQLRKQIEDRISAELALKKRDDTVRSIFLAAPTGIGLVANRVLIQVNEKFCSMLGYTEDEVIGKSSAMLYPDQSEFTWVGEEKYRQIMERGTGTVETVWKTKDGSLIHVLLSSTPLDRSDLDLGVTFTALDITERRKAAEEKRYLEERLARSHKMEALGLLAGGVAHDLNNVLSGIVSYPDLLLADMPQDSPMRKAISTIKESGEKAGAIVEDLLTLARRGVVNTTILNLNTLVTSYLRSPEHERILNGLPGTVITTSLSENLLNIRGSSVHLNKALMNLIANAIEAMPVAGKIEIITRNEYVDQPIKGYEHVKKGDFVVLTVKDDGIGIEKDDLKHIFEPFYTNKVMGQSGTGLGMSVVWGTVQDHNGYINVDSEPGEGTEFELYFPVSRDELAEKKIALCLKDYQGHGESILVIDDDKGQRDIATALLTKLGYEVHSVSSGEEAVVYLQKNNADLLVLDMILNNGIDGLETYQIITSTNPQQKAIVASGFAETDRVKETLRLGAGEYVKKPYTLEKIGMAVKKELTT